MVRLVAKRGSQRYYLSTALTPLASGNHTIYVHGQDSAGNWGPTNFAVLNLDKIGPASSGLTLTPSRTNGTVNVVLHATGNDSASGGSAIASAQYQIDGGTGRGDAVPRVRRLPAWMQPSWRRRSTH